MYEMVNVSADEGTLEMENLPSTSVIEPIVVPLTRTDAPTTGSPSSEEVTTPFTDLTWDHAIPIPINRMESITKILLFIKSIQIN